MATGGLIFPDLPFRLSLKQADKLQIMPPEVTKQCKGNYFRNHLDGPKKVNYRIEYKIIHFTNSIFLD